MGWIKERILTEYAKHGNRLDWALIAEKKIASQMIYMLKDSLMDKNVKENEHAPKLIFSGNGEDSEEHIKNCKIVKCKTCVELKEFLDRCEEDEDGK